MFLTKGEKIVKLLPTLRLLSFAWAQDRQHRVYPEFVERILAMTGVSEIALDFKK